MPPVRETLRDRRPAVARPNCCPSRLNNFLTGDAPYGASWHGERWPLRSSLETRASRLEEGVREIKGSVAAVAILH